MLCDLYNKYETAISAPFLLLAVVVQVLMQMMQEGSSQSGQRHQTVYQEPLHVITSVFPHSGSSSPTIVNKVCLVSYVSCVKFEWSLKFILNAGVHLN